MNWEAVGAIAELVGAIGVIVSLIYLAIQIRHNSTNLEQNTALARSNAAVLAASHGADFNRAMAVNPDLGRIWLSGHLRFDGLSEEEAQRFELLMISQLIEIDVNYFLVQNGSLDPDVFAIWERVLERWAQHPHFRAMWESGRIRWMTTESFSRRIGEIIRSQSN